MRRYSTEWSVEGVKLRSVTEVSLRLRKWLNTLSDRDLSVVLSMSDKLRSGAQLPPAEGRNKAASRRELIAARAWLAKAITPQLNGVATSSLGFAAKLLTYGYGFPQEVVNNPDLEGLGSMLTALGRPLGQLALFGLLLDEQAASPLARQHRAALDELVAAAEHRQLPEPGAHAEPAERLEAPADLDVVALQVGAVRELAGLLARQLRGIADQVFAGRAAAEAPAPLLAEYAKARDAVVRDLGAVDDGGFEQFDARLAQLREERASRLHEQETRARRAEELREQIRSMEGFIASTAEDRRAPLETAVQALRDELAELAPMDHRPDLADSVTEVVGLLRTPAAASLSNSEHPSAPDDSREHVDEPGASAEQQLQPEQPAPSQSEAAREPVAEPEPALVPDLALGFPWEEGEPPLVVALIAADRIAEAYWVTKLSGEPDRRATVLQFATAAYSTQNNDDATAVLADYERAGASLEGDPEAAALAVSAILRAGLIAGWGPQLLSALRTELTLLGPWADLVDASIDAVRQGYRVDRDGVPLPSSDADQARAELGVRADALLHELPLRTNTYHRATRVLQRLTREGQPLHRALQAVSRWANKTGPQENVSKCLHELSAPGAIDAMIEQADAAMRTPKQAREAIYATALRSLVRDIEKVRALVHEADVVARRLTSGETDDSGVALALSRALAELQSAQPLSGLVGAALSLLHRWLSDPDRATSSGSLTTSSSADGYSGPNIDVLLTLHDLPRDVNGLPDASDTKTPEVLARLVSPADPSEAVDAYCLRGDLRAARRVLELTEEGLWSTSSDVSSMSDAISAAAETWRRQHHMAHTKARDLFARIRTQNLLDQTEETTVGGRLEALSAVTDWGFDLAAAKVESLIEELDGKQRQRIEELHTELGTTSVEVADTDRERILGLLADGDTVTATEFLAFVRAGKPLPAHVEKTAEELKAFAELLAEHFTGGPETAAGWAELAAGGTQLSELGSNGVAAWDVLRDHRMHTGDKMPTVVRNIMRALGVTSTDQPKEIDKHNGRGYRKFRVQGGSTGSYVAALGSAASEFMVTVLVEELRGRQILEVLRQQDSGRANVVLSLHPLDLQSRRALAAQAVTSGVQALVIDRAVMGWVAATAPGSWQATQRVTLPWTTLNPYTPFVAGLVPPEVFVGRHNEMSEVSDPAGGLFVYGGRQLGKSALLRRVEAIFRDGESRHAIYLDLKGRGIGEAEPAERIWQELAVELKAHGVLDRKVGADPGADTVVSLVKTWLAADQSRRLLLLADEADAFLTADSRAVPTPGGVAHFRNVLRLKELMESTERRFKVVFAGLHQVQRFGNLSNVPLAHGGPDILVGPLDPPDARHLVVEPMAALGYCFERPELVWRLLSATNYQASLIQIFCEQLVQALQGRVVKSRALPVVVTESDVDAVAASDRVRERIAERLRITINLEDRYRVLTLVIALHSLNDDFGADYAPEQLLAWAREHWPAGFDDLTASQVRIYLDEMVGLGLLIRLSGRRRYAVRSPNVVNMLGTRADLERELDETDFDLPYEYNPRDARRLLGVFEGRECRSPLTDGQLSELIASGTPSVVTGTAALGVDRVPDALRNYAEMRGSQVEVVDTATGVTKAVTAAARRNRTTVLVADLRRRSLHEVTMAADRLSRSQSTSVVLVDVDIASEVAEKLGCEPVRPARWTNSSLRSWPECPFDVPVARDKVIRSTGGWPELVERLMGKVNSGTTQAHALEWIHRSLADQSRAEEQLRASGLDAALLGRLGSYVDYFEPGEFVSPADVGAALELDLSEVIELLAELAATGVLDESPEGVALDQVTHRCLATVRGGR